MIAKKTARIGNQWKNQDHPYLSISQVSYNNQESPADLRKATVSVENLGINRDHLNYNIVEINQNCEKGPIDWRRLALTQTPVNDHH